MMNDYGVEGVSHISTRRQNTRRIVAVVLAVFGAAVCLYLGAGLASMVQGHGWHHPTVKGRPVVSGTGGLLRTSGGEKPANRLQFPLVVHLPVAFGWTAAAAAPMWLLWLRMQSRALGGRRHPGPERHRGLATLPNIRRQFSGRAVRRTGTFTLPRIGRWSRMWLPTSMFGYHIGHPHRPAAPGTDLWVHFEARLRIIARTGWGKSWRLLIPMIRQLPGPAVITSIEAEIFTATVKARMWRRPPVRFAWMRLLRRKWRAPVRYPVVVADLSAPESRFAAGFPQLRANPIVGAENFKIATTRARGLVAGGDTDGETAGETDKFFRSSATQVLAAWLQAAAMDPTKDIEDLVEWLRDTDLDTPSSILAEDATPEARAAVMNMATHLDPAAGRTTSGVKRYLNFAISSMASGQGRVLCGPRTGPQFDMDALIRAGGTVYLLAEVDEMELARPLLTMLAGEMFMSAERTARTMPGRRLPYTFMGIFDELKAGVRLAILPYVTTVQRKYGISFAYAIQSSMDEEEMFGKAGAQRLRDNSVTIVGGYDGSSAQETARRAGKTPIVVASRGTGGHRSEHTQLEDTLPESDQGELEDGQSVVLGRGILPFLAATDRVDKPRQVRAQIRQEVREVDAYVARRRASVMARTEDDDLLARAGITTWNLTKENA